MTKLVETLAGWREADKRRVIIRELQLNASIGIHPQERARKQPVIISLELSVIPGEEIHNVVFAPPRRDGDPAALDVICYESVSNMIQALLDAGHIDYVETLAERIVARCLADDRIVMAAVLVLKPDAISSASSAGVEIVRHR